MRYTFRPDDCMVITIPLGSIKNGKEGQLMPNQFTCRFKDTYKVFQRSRPKALGAAQIITAVFILCLGAILLIWKNTPEKDPMYIVPSILYLMCGTLTIIAGHTPIMLMMKASFTFNIIGLCLAVATIVSCLMKCTLSFSAEKENTLGVGHILVVIYVLYAIEFLLSVVLIYWESKAVCRAHFNTLPMITLKEDM